MSDIERTAGDIAVQIENLYVQAHSSRAARDNAVFECISKGLQDFWDVRIRHLSGRYCTSQTQWGILAVEGGRS
jgi:hypothetical protein